MWLGLEASRLLRKKKPTIKSCIKKLVQLAWNTGLTSANVQPVSGNRGLILTYQQTSDTTGVLFELNVS